VDHQFVPLGVEEDQFEQVAGAARPDDQVPRRVVAKLCPSDRVLQGVPDVLVGDPVASSGTVDLHMG
jgi:hypothetical protein